MMPTWLEALLTFLLTPSPIVFAIGGAVVILAPILLHLIVTSSTPYATLPRVLVLGPADGGKTTLATLLERGPGAGPADTHTSQAPLTVELTAARGEGWEDAGKETISEGGGGGHRSGRGHTKFLLVDVPGHPKLRGRATARLVPSAVDAERVRAIVFVVDAAALGGSSGGVGIGVGIGIGIGKQRDNNTLSETATYLYDVLLALQRRAAALGSASSSSSRRTRSVPLLVAANKTDLFTALPAAAARTALEAEMTRIRASRSRGLLDSGVGGGGGGGGDSDLLGAGEQDAWLGRWGSERFDMGQMAEWDVEVDFLDGCVRGEGGPRIDDWWAWIAERV